MQARLAFGTLLALGLADLAVLDVHLAPQLAAQSTDVPQPVKTPVADGGTLTRSSTTPAPPVTAPSSTSVAPPPPTTAVAEPSARALPSSAPGPSGTMGAATSASSPSTAKVAPTAAVTVASPATKVAEKPPVQSPATKVVEKPPVQSTATSTAGEAVQDIVFDLDSHLISSVTAIAQLKAVVQQLNRDQSKRILLRGHSDQMGSPEYKRALSQRRAMTVQSFLVSHGAPADRISIEAVGDNEPADPRNNPVAWAQNRRVQVLWR